MTEASSKKTLYEILGVKPESTPAEIQAAFDTLSAAAPPGDEARRLALKEAHRVLSNERRRAAYDDSLRERELPPIQAIEDDDERAARHRKLLIGGVAVLLLVAGWWFMRAPARPAAAPVSAAARAAAPAAATTPTPAPAPVETAAPAEPAPETQLHGGTWHCQGPLTGRGLDLNFSPDGTYAGQSDGDPIRGYYTLSASTLVFTDGGQSNRFAVEELAAQRLVLHHGEGKRLTCSR